jgi:hypothetical protein
MTRAPDKMAALAALAGLVADRALAPVAVAQARLAAARAKAGALAQTRATLATDAADPLQAALMARQSERMRHRHIAAMSDLARLQADLELAKEAARPAYGRKLALDRLLAQRRTHR